MRACHSIGLVERQLRLLIKQSGHYAIQAVYMPTTLGKVFAEEKRTLTLPSFQHMDTSSSSSCASLDLNCSLDASLSNPSASQDISCKDKHTKTRIGKGSHCLTMVCKLMENKGSWAPTACRQASIPFSRYLYKPTILSNALHSRL